MTTIEVDFDPDPADHSFEKTFVFVIREGDRLIVEADTHLIGLFELSEMLDAMREAGFNSEASRWELSDLPHDGDYPLITAVRQV